MRWTPRQLMLPLLVAISLTGVGLGIIYLLLEKENEKNRKDGSRKGERPPDFMTLEIKVPKEFVPVIIGRAGTMVKSIENATSTRIRFSDEDPDSKERACRVKGSSEGLRMAQAMINTMIASQPLVETYETYVPQRACPKIIGRAGETINRIQSSSNAKIILERAWSRDPDSKRRVIIKGTAEQIASALSQIEDRVHEYSEALEKLVASESTRSPRGHKITPRIAAVNPSSDIPLLAQRSIDEALTESAMEVYVSAIENPSQFWVQVAGPGTLSLDELLTDMTTYYENEENRELHALKEITVGQTVAAKFLFDGKWYRAEVTASLDDEKCEVYYLDYGDHEIVPTNCILELRTDFLSLRLQAIECCLANVKPRDGDWSVEASERFGDLTWVAQWKILIAKVRGYKERALGCGSSRREGSPIPCVDLYDKVENQDINIGKQLVAENFADAEEDAWSAASSTLSLSRRSNDVQRSPTPVRSPPPPAKDDSPIMEPPKTTKNRVHVEEVDLTTPQKSARPVEEVDLVTPVKSSSARLIDNEKSEHRDNGVDDSPSHREYGNGHCSPENGSSKIHGAEKRNILPAGCESDESENSDDYGFE